MNHRSSLAALALSAALIATACGGDDGGGGPEAVSTGSYRAYASSSGGAVADASLEVDADRVVVSSGPGVTESALGSEQGSYLLCPPDGSGPVRPLSIGLTIGTVDLEEPAVFGDCGVTTPRRVTVVDLASLDEGLAFPFTRWVEFCDVTHPDC